jgi:hypothetical protein
VTDDCFDQSTLYPPPQALYLEEEEKVLKGMSHELDNKKRTNK